jgi:hypothetical protein
MSMCRLRTIDSSRANPRQSCEEGIVQLKSQLAANKKSLAKLLTAEKATLDSLTVPQQQTVQANSIGASGTHRHVYQPGLHPGETGRRFRLRPARQAIPVGRDQALQL